MLHDATDRPLFLPTVYEPVAFEEPALVFDEACRLASKRGAGTFVHGEGAEVLAVAVVLEPEQPLVQARFAFFVGMSAIADALSAHCLPEREIAFTWPDTVLYDTARLGGGRLSWAETEGESAVPDWMVFGFQLLRGRPGLVDTGDWPDSISLAEEEFEETSALVESFARHLMRGFDAWQAEGLSAVTSAYLERLRSESGHERLIDGRGDLLERRSPRAQPVRRQLLDGLAAQSWYDPERKRPRW